MDLTIRPMSAADIPAAKDILDRAFHDQTVKITGRGRLPFFGDRLLAQRLAGDPDGTLSIRGCSAGTRVIHHNRLAPRLSGCDDPRRAAMPIWSQARPQDGWRGWTTDCRHGGTISAGAQVDGVTILGGFSDILKDDSPWVIGGFAPPDGSRWEYREPGAVVIAQGGRLRVSVPRLTRRHDRVQILDNAKHMYFSRERVATNPDGETAFDINFRSVGYHTAPRDLYDGFISWNLLDFETGLALDFFVSNDTIATVYARLPFPGVPEPATGDPKYFALFKELVDATAPGQPHDYRVVYDYPGDEVRWYVDGELVNREVRVPVKVSGFTVALGLMTEKDIGPQGSTSLHGQGLLGDWSAVRVTRSSRE